MKTRWIAAAAVLAAAAFPTQATAAATFSATAEPAEAGFVDITLMTEIANGPGGAPPAASAVTQLLPPEYVSGLGSFGSCGPAAFSNADGPTAVNCPDQSAVIGNGVVTVVGDFGQGQVSLSSDQASVVKTGPSELALWWHVSSSANNPEVHGVFPAAVAPSGGRLALNWDLASMPAPMRLSTFETTFSRTASADAAPFAATACGSGTWAFDLVVSYATGEPADTGSSPQPCRRGTSFEAPAAGGAGACKVPRVRAGSTLRAARAKLGKAGCAAGRVRKVRSKRVRRGRVIRVAPRPGTPLAAGRKVAIYVSAGP